MKPIFHSLGSNYDWKFLLISLQQLFGMTTKKSTALRRKIAEFWNLDEDQIHLVYKGRDAIEVALRSYGIGQGDTVLTQAFSCFAIEEAILRTGAHPVYADIANGSTNASVETFDKAFQDSPQAKAILVQHSLGHPADIKNIALWAKKKGLLLIEDVAQSLGGTDEDGQVLGSYAEAIILSFGRDKMVDGVSGGAVAFRKKPSEIISLPARVSNSVQYKDMLYPPTTWKIRTFYNLGLGKIIHWVAVKLKLMESPTKTLVHEYSSLPPRYILGILYQLEILHQELKHRQEIAQFYKDNLEESTKIQHITSQAAIHSGSNLRYALSVQNPQSLSDFLASKNIHLADRWYRSPVDSGKLQHGSKYQSGSCPNAESLSKSIYNLPTHKNILLSDAKRIVQTIAQWEKL